MALEICFSVPLRRLNECLCSLKKFTLFPLIILIQRVSLLRDLPFTFFSDEFDSCFHSVVCSDDAQDLLLPVPVLQYHLHNSVRRVDCDHGIGDCAGDFPTATLAHVFNSQHGGLSPAFGINDSQLHPQRVLRRTVGADLERLRVITIPAGNEIPTQVTVYGCCFHALSSFLFSCAHR
jgi:hypothetical protein